MSDVDGATDTSEEAGEEGGKGGLGAKQGKGGQVPCCKFVLCLAIAGCCCCLCLYYMIPARTGTFSSSLRSTSVGGLCWPIARSPMAHRPRRLRLIMALWRSSHWRRQIVEWHIRASVRTVIRTVHKRCDAAACRARHVSRAMPTSHALRHRHARMVVPAAPTVCSRAIRELRVKASSMYTVTFVHL